LSWADLEDIYMRHSGNIANLEPTANYIADRLRQLDEVHSLKIRIKHPEHLLEKIIRKKLSDESFEITPENYTERITDLIGLRVLHLFKEDWTYIHDFIVKTWELNEPPTANVRKGDPDELTNLFKDKGCEINEHKFGYRSVHYLVKSQPSRDLFIAELQVRTIFEEGWSEIDHRIRYPYNLDNVVLAQFLVIFNRLAGSADEMGSFIRFLKDQLETRDEEHKRALEKHKEIVTGLKEEIQKLEITRQQKEELEERLRSLSGVPPQKILTVNYDRLINKDIIRPIINKEHIVPRMFFQSDLVGPYFTAEGFLIPSSVGETLLRAPQKIIQPAANITEQSKEGNTIEKNVNSVKRSSKKTVRRKTSLKRTNKKTNRKKANN
jgi:putative GTP pyrophosphokinase